MKKILHIGGHQICPGLRYLVLLMIALATTFPTFAITFVIDGFRYETLPTVSNDVKVTGTYKTSSGAIVIPASVTYNGTSYSVTTIGDYALSDLIYVTSITLPNSLTDIGHSAFQGCTGLTEITIPNGVTKFGVGVFRNCTGLTEITIPNGVTSFGSYAFEGCTGLTEITIPNGVTKIEWHAFQGCTGLKTIILPNSITDIGDYAFAVCSGLTSITIPESVTSIGSSAFKDCTRLTSITLPNSITEIKTGTFYNCSGLTSVTIPNSVTSIGSSAFSGCTLKPLKILSNKVITLDSGAFDGMESGSEIVCSHVNYTAINNLWKNSYPHDMPFLDIKDVTTYFCGVEFNIVNSNPYFESDTYDVTCFAEIPEANITDVPISATNTNFVKGLKPATNYTLRTYGMSGSEKFICDESRFKTKETGIIKDVKPYYCGVEFNIENSPNPVIEPDASGISYFAEIPEADITGIPISATSTNLVKGLKPDTNYTLKTYYMWGSEKFICDESSFRTKETGIIKDVTTYYCGVEFNIEISPNPYFESDASGISYFAEVLGAKITDVPVSSTNINLVKGLKPDTNYTLRTYYMSDGEKVICKNESFKTKKPEMSIDYDATQTIVTINSTDANCDKTCTPKIYVEGKEYKGGELKFTGLNPNNYYAIRVSADYNGYIINRYLSTKDISISILNPTTYPTSIECTGNFNLGDAKLKKLEWRVSGELVSTTENLILTGLSPKDSYNIYFNVYVDCANGSTYKKEMTKTVETESIALEIQTPKSVGNGKTIVSAMTNISEDELNVGFEWKKSDAPATLPYSEGYSVICDGRLEGLIKNLQNTYYNVRAFYKTANGTYYYSDIISFDPTDFSYFEPTVHTYPAEPQETQATLRGYVLGGTDNISGQGFQYWRASSDGKWSADRFTAPEAGADVKTVAADGQRMSIVITDLLPGTTYIYRAYAETDAGFKYGEEQTFTTVGTSGIEDVADDEQEVTVVGYYDLQGSRYDAPQRGFNIVLYSNGKSSKIIRK